MPTKTNQGPLISVPYPAEAQRTPQNGKPYVVGPVPNWFHFYEPTATVARNESSAGPKRLKGGDTVVAEQFELTVAKARVKHDRAGNAEVSWHHGSARRFSLIAGEAVSYSAHNRFTIYNVAGGHVADFVHGAPDLFVITFEPDGAVKITPIAKGGYVNVDVTDPANLRLDTTRRPQTSVKPEPFMSPNGAVRSYAF